MRAAPTLVALLLLVALPSSGSMQPQQLTPRESESFSIADLFSRADTVVLASVTAGDTRSYDVPLFKAQVLQAFKGASNGATLFFSPFAGMQVDMQYFLFLRNAPTPISPRPGPSHGFGTVPYLEVFDGGYTSMPTSYQCVFTTDPKHHCDYAVKVCTDYISLPASVDTSGAPGASGPPPNCRWIKKDVFTTLLGDLVRAEQ